MGWLIVVRCAKGGAASSLLVLVRYNGTVSFPDEQLVLCMALTDDLKCAD